jgi:hypothetical protein
MRFALTADQRDFFNRNSFIEFEEMLSSDQAIALKTNADQVLAARLHIPKENLARQQSSALFQAGYDLWRDNEIVKKTEQKNAFAALASELLQILPLRFAFDQYILTARGSNSPFSQSFTLQETSCLFPLAGALILLLEDVLQPFADFPLPLKSGNGLFISPSLPIPWPKLYSTPNLCFIAIGFAMEKTLFRADTRDPHAVNLKRLGYVFNDLLKDSLHPLLIIK